MQKLYFAFATMLLLAFGCNTPKTFVATPIEIRELDTLVITPSEKDYEEVEDGTVPNDYQLPAYRAAFDRKFDLLHTKLTLRFDWEKEQVIGQAELKLTPIAKERNTLRLDAKGFDFKVIRLADSGQELQYNYDNKQEVFIDLGKTFSPGQEVNLYIDYIATPKASGGSDAITSDKGLYFINPRGENPSQAQQIWTQGETESNSRWFPTIDKPNERCTQEMVVTVDDKYEVLSNGLLINSTKNADGTRTDYWKMDLPHAPYLFMLAIGEFAVVEDEDWNGIPIDYYVEEAWEPYAKEIFPYTPEMLTFFSELTGVKYPWPKYSQVVVREYVSGAMENTTGVIFGDFMYGDDRELMDAEINEKIVAHEMFHHWFGDLVTCESWSNLTLNEGFANYSEYLWLEQKHGKDAADEHLRSEWAGYLGSLAYGGEPHELIWYDYDDKEQMFDAHSYNKGGAVLHMLRNYLGDDIFFDAVQHYLEENKFSPVEVDELRMAFEEVSGKDLNWFFNQWFHKAGHPRLELMYGYDTETKTAYVEVKQVQSTLSNTPAVFILPVMVDVYTANSALPERHEVVVNQRSQRFNFPADTKPELIVFDAEHQLLAEVTDNRTQEELLVQLTKGKRFLDRIRPLEELEEAKAIESAVLKALSDPYGGVRMAAIDRLEGDLSDPVIKALRVIAANDKDSETRAAALTQLAVANDKEATALAQQALKAKSYIVVGAGLEALMAIDRPTAIAEAKSLEDSDNSALIEAIASLYGVSNDLSKLDYFRKKRTVVTGRGAFSFYNTYGGLLTQLDEPAIFNELEEIAAIARNRSEAPVRRLAAFRTMAQVYGTLSVKSEPSAMLVEKLSALKESLQSIKRDEPAGQIKDILGQLYAE